jgi:hypothetical protein
MRRVPRVTQAMRKSLDVARDRNGNPQRGGIMVVPSILSPEAWQKLATVHQRKLLQEAKL